MKTNDINIDTKPEPCNNGFKVEIVLFDITIHTWRDLALKEV